MDRTSLDIRSLKLSPSLGMMPDESIKYRMMIDEILVDFNARCPSILLRQVRKPRVDSIPLHKPDIGADKWRFKVSPKYNPAEFWGKRFYEFAVGSLGEPFGNSDLAHAQFFFDPLHLSRPAQEAVERIMNDVASEYPDRFKVKNRKTKTGGAYHYLCATYSDPQSIKERGAVDLAMLIELTLGRFQSTLIVP